MKTGRKLIGIVATLVFVAFLSFFGPLLLPDSNSGYTAQAAGVINISGDNKVGRMRVVNGKSQTVRVSRSFAEIVVGNPETADVSPLTNQSLYVLGRKLGTTNVTLFDKDKQVVAIIDIEVTHDTHSLRQALRRNIPKGNVRVRSINGRILLDGSVPSATAAKRAMEIAKAYSGNDNVSNSLTIAANQQVNLEVRFLEVFREAGKELGINYNFTNKGNGALQGTSVATGPNFGTTVGAAVLSSSITPFGAILANVLKNGNSPDIVISALESKNLARRLAEPNLTALSGETASFVAGGEFPIPVSDDDGKVTIEFKRFGVKLKFRPIVLDSGVINLEIEPEVSQIDPNVSIRTAANGVLIPGLSVRALKTSVELRSGQSFALAGLLQNVNERTVDQLPWLGDIPVLGTLFRSSAFQKRQTDLVIIVTPRLVRPVGTRKKLKTPLDNHYSSNEKELFLFGKLEVSKKELDRKYNGLYGHILDLPRRANNAVYKK